MCRLTTLVSKNKLEIFGKLLFYIAKYVDNNKVVVQNELHTLLLTNVLKIILSNENINTKCSLL